MIAVRTFICSATVLMTAFSVLAEERIRTPAEIELRSSEIEQRLLVLAQEATDVAATLQIIDARLGSASDAARGAVLLEAAHAAARQRTIDQEAEHF